MSHCMTWTLQMPDLRYGTVLMLMFASYKLWPWVFRVITFKWLLNSCSLFDLREAKTFSPWWDSSWSPKRQRSQVEKKLSTSQLASPLGLAMCWLFVLFYFRQAASWNQQGGKPLYRPRCGWARTWRAVRGRGAHAGHRMLHIPPQSTWEHHRSHCRFRVEPRKLLDQVWFLKVTFIIS